VVVRYNARIGAGKWMEPFVHRNALGSNAITLTYDYPYHRSNTDDHIKHFIAALPEDRTTTRAFILLFYRALKVPGTPFSVPKRLMKGVIRLGNKLVVDPVFAEDGAALALEQAAWERHWDNPIAELNPQVKAFQELTVRKWSEWLERSAGRAARRGRGVNVIPCYEPATRAPLGTVAVDGPDAVAAAIAAARVAQIAWAQRPLKARLAVLQDLLTHVLDHADALCEVVCRDAGKTREHAMMGEIWPVAEKLRWTIANAERHLADEPVSSGLVMHKSARIEYRPLGVVGVICPWNYPLQNVLGPVIPALAAGNGAVVKVSEWVAWSSARIQQIFDEVLTAHGVSTDLVRLVNGYGETGAALVSGGVDLVVFTGSVGNGRKVVAGSAATLVPVIAELGGKDAMIVCDDADLDQAVHSLLAGVFINAGQNCLSSERILVHDGIYDRFEAAVVTAVSALRVGPPLGPDPVDVGAIISPIQLDLIEDLVRRSVAAGARVLVGGARALPEVGQFFAPTVLAGVEPGMPIFEEETFGPVVALCRVRDDDHAVALANGTSFGLSSTVFSRDAARARFASGPGCRRAAR
jgi:acyl-CoA reductase-like NAD-dependent aldehyde dehydrogenase